MWNPLERSYLNQQQPEQWSTVDCGIDVTAQRVDGVCTNRFWEDSSVHITHTAPAAGTQECWDTRPRALTHQGACKTGYSQLLLFTDIKLIDKKW